MVGQSTIGQNGWPIVDGWPKWLATRQPASKLILYCKYNTNPPPPPEGLKLCYEQHINMEAFTCKKERFECTSIASKGFEPSSSTLTDDYGRATTIQARVQTINAPSHKYIQREIERERDGRGKSVLKMDRYEQAYILSTFIYFFKNVL